MKSTTTNTHLTMSSTPNQPTTPPSSSPPTPSPPAPSKKPTLRERMTRLVREKGVAALLAYGIMEGLTYSLAFIAMLIIWNRGNITWKWPTDKKAWVVIAPGMVLINQFTRPIRIAGAFLLADWVKRLIVEPAKRVMRSWRMKWKGQNVNEAEE